MAAIAALDPRDAAEAVIAAQVVMAEAHGRASLESANENQHDLKVIMQGRAQARSVMRQAQDSPRGLQSLQATPPIPAPEAVRDQPDAAPTSVSPAEPAPGSVRALSQGMTPTRTQPGHATQKPNGFYRSLARPSSHAGIAHAMSDHVTNRDSETNSSYAGAESSPSRAYGT